MCLRRIRWLWKWIDKLLGLPGLPDAVLTWHRWLRWLWRVARAIVFPALIAFREWVMANLAEVALYIGAFLLSLSGVLSIMREISRSQEKTRRESMSQESTWISREEAFALVRRSPAVRRLAGPIDFGTLLVHRITETSTINDETMDAATRMMLLRFEQECPEGIRDGVYAKEMLEPRLDQETAEDARRRSIERAAPSS